MEKTIYVDVDLCSGCGACVVACMDQNDVYPERGQPPLRRVYRVEEGEDQNATILYVSTACMHCEDSPCVMGCPTGAIIKESESGTVLVNSDLCIGCHSCALACPFGVPRFDPEDKMQKCRLCVERIKAGLEPACVRVCTTRALRFKHLNELLGEKEAKLVGNVISSAKRYRSGYRS